MSTLNQWITQIKWFRSLAFTFLVYVLIVITQLSFDTLNTLEFTALNQAYMNREELDVNPDILFWNIDDSDVEMLRWPWAWDRFAWIVKTLDRYGAKVGVIQSDVFSDAGNLAISEEQMMEKMEALSDVIEDDEQLKIALQNISASSSQAMVEATKAWPHMVLSQYFFIPDHQNPVKLQQRTEEQKKTFISSKVKTVEGVKTLGRPVPENLSNLMRGINTTPLSRELHAQVQGVGFARIWPDQDGVIRRNPTVLNYDGTLFPSQAIAAAAAYYGMSIDDLIITKTSITFPGIKNPKTGDELSVPIDELGLMYVNWTAEIQINEFEFSPFAPIKSLINVDMAKDIAWRVPFDEDNIGAAFNAIVQNLSLELDKFGWVLPKHQNHVEVALWWLIQHLLGEGYELPEMLAYFGAFNAQLDIDLIYQTLLLNNLTVMQFDEFEGQIPTFEQAISNEDYVLQSNGMLLAFLETNLQSDPDLLAMLAENGLISIDDDFASDDYERVLFHRLDLDLEDWIGALGLPKEELGDERKRLLTTLYDYFHKKERIIRNGYQQTLFHCELGNLEEVYPLYFPLGKSFNITKEESANVSLMDVKDKVVFVGLTGTGLNALNPTPYAGRYTMAALNSTAFNTVTTGAFIQRLSWVEPLTIIGYAFLVFLFVFYLPAFASLPLTLGLAAGHVFLSIDLLEDKGYIVAMVSPILSVLSAYIVSNIYLYIEQQRERQKIRGMFSSMVSPEVLKIMEDEPEKFNLQGEKAEASMFSSDVSGFTSISEGVTAQELALILNLYLTPMSNLVMTYGGYVEKYEGDAIKADFGIPLPDGEHAWKACFSALLQQEELTVVQRMLQIKYGVMITARMGVNTGVVNAGNMGSEQKMQYCAIGEEVAMAEELEPANKMWETWIAISPETLRLSGDKLETRLLDIVEFPHVTIPVYELLGWKKEIFLEFWSGKPIPKLVIEGWERIIPEKLLAYLDYYREHTFVGNGFYDLMMSAFGQQEEPCMEYVKVNDQIEMAGMEKRYQELLKGVDSYGVKVELDDLDLVDRTEMDGLIKAQTEAEEPWRQRINGYLVELKWRTHKVNRFESSVPQSEIDEFNTGIDTLEKNCNCYIKRNKFPIEGDRYGMTFKSHLVQMLPNPSQNLSDEEIATLSQRRDKLTDQLKQAMASFVLKSKAVAPAYHEMMADHCLLGQTKREVCGIFEKGRELYLEQKWDAAKELFQQGLEKVPDDGPCITFINRCDQYKANPPAEGWDGTWEADW